MNECGLDPGIDHMLAMEAFHNIKAEGGKVGTVYYLPKHWSLHCTSFVLLPK